MNTPDDREQSNGQKRVSYGNPIVGVLRCLECGYDCFPRHLREMEARPPFRCPDCGNELVYDEEE